MHNDNFITSNLVFYTEVTYVKLIGVETKSQNPLNDILFDFQNQVNEFKKDKSVQDIKFSTHTYSMVGSVTKTLFIAMIIWNDQKEKA